MTQRLNDAQLREIEAGRCRFGCDASDHAADLVAEIRRLRGQPAEPTIEFGVRQPDGTVLPFVDGRLAQIVSHEPGNSLLRRTVGPWTAAEPDSCELIEEPRRVEQ